MSRDGKTEAGRPGKGLLCALRQQRIALRHSGNHGETEILVGWRDSFDLGECLGHGAVRVSHQRHSDFWRGPGHLVPGSILKQSFVLLNYAHVKTITLFS